MTDCVLTVAHIANDIEISDTCTIDNATSSTYIPTAADATNKLQARATYKDALGDDSASVTSEQDSVVRPNANAAPRFHGLSDPVARSVSENVANAGVGDPVAAADSDPLLYTLSGDDAGSFKVDDSGQIQTKVKLDYETKSSYTGDADGHRPVPVQCVDHGKHHRHRRR